jgi:hypothetical protein
LGARKRLLNNIETLNGRCKRLKEISALIDENFFDFITEYTCIMEENRKAKESIKKLFENKSFKDFKVRAKYVKVV